MFSGRAYNQGDIFSCSLVNGLISWWEGLKAVVYACARHSGIGEGAKRTKLKKPAFFNDLLLTICQYVELVIISYIAVLFYLDSEL